MSKTAIFIQASADIIHAKNLIENHLDNEDSITVFVCNSESFLKQIESFNFNVKTKYLNLALNLDPKKVWKFKSYKNKVDCYWNTEVRDVFEKIYFFSIYEDLLTFIWIKKFTNICNNIIYYNHYDDLTILSRKKSKSLKLFFYAFIYSELFDVKISNKYHLKFPRFDFEKYDCIEENKPSKADILVKKENKFKIDKIKGLQNLLFLYSDSLDNVLDKMQLEFLKKINKKKYRIIFKSHPRISTPLLFNDIIDVEVPNFISAEFIDYYDIEYCVGYHTAALCFPAKNNLAKTYSFLDIQDAKNDSLISYLNAYSNNEIVYAQNIFF